MTALLTWGWQGTALAVAALLAFRTTRRIDAATRYALWWGVLVAVVALPWLPSLVSAGPASAAPTPAAGLAAAEARWVLPAPPDWIVAIGLGAWLGTVLIGALRIALGVRHVTRLKREAHPLAADRQRRLPLWSAAQPARPIALLVSSLARTACAVGGRRPAIVLPPSLVEAMDDDALDQVVMHECAHLERRDDVGRVAEAVVDCLFGLHPAVRIALAQIDLEREAACDDRVVLQTDAPVRYASSLADAAVMARSPRGTRLIAAAVAGRSALAARIERVLDGSRTRRARLTPAVTIAGIVVLGAASTSASQLAPLVAFDAVRAVEAIVVPAVTATVTANRAAAPAASAEAPAAADPDRERRQAPEPRRAGVTDPATPVVAPGSLPGAPIALPPAPASAPLAARPLAVAASQGPAPLSSARLDQHEGAAQSPWAAAADGGAAIGAAAGRGGVAVGTGMKKAGTAVAGFFTRAGRAVGNSF